MPNNKFVEKGLKNTKSRAVKAAKDLLKATIPLLIDRKIVPLKQKEEEATYGDDVVEALENSTTVGEIDHIMVTARNKNRVGYSEY